MVRSRRIPLVIEVMKQRDDTPFLFVCAGLPRIPPYRGFDRQRVLAQALSGRPLGQQLPRVGPGRHHRTGLGAC